MKLIRRDVGYTIISRFEEAFRYFLSDKILIFFPKFETELPAGVVRSAKERANEISFGSIDELLENTNFTHLTEIICFSGMYSSYFPETTITQKEFQEIMGLLYELRCKIAHIRQYFTSIDLDMLTENTRKIAENLENHGNEFLQFLSEVGSHPEKVVIPTPTEFLCDTDPIDTNIPHNVPTPDYEFEGGFVGRDEDIKKIMSLLDGNLHRVITISGAGGVGKTALALRIAQKYLRSTRNPFDGIIWLSAKETKLSYLGIEDN